MQAEDGAALEALQRATYGEAGPGIVESWPPANALDVAGLTSFLATTDYGVLSTTLPDGRPQARPVYFVVADGAFWIASIAGQRLRNLAARPHASLVVLVGHRRQHRMVAVDGSVTQHALEAVRDRLEEAWIASRGGSESWPTWAATMLELRPARVYSYGSPTDGEGESTSAALDDPWVVLQELQEQVELILAGSTRGESFPVLARARALLARRRSSA